MKKQLSLRESIFMIAGGGIGAGILTIPFLMNKVGLVPTIFLLLFAYLLSALVHTIVAELAINTNGLQMLSAFKEYLFTKKNTKVMTIIFFIIMSIMIFSNLSAYIIGGSEVLANILNVDILYARFIFYMVSAVIVLLGLKTIAKSEIVSVSVIILITMVGFIISMGNINNYPNLVNGHYSNYLVIFSLLMFCFSSEFTAFQVGHYIEDKKNIKKAIFGGLLINMLVTIILSLSIVYASKEVTEVGIVGWGDSVGGIVGVMSSIFVLIALIDSFWIMSYSMANIVVDETKMGFNVSWIIASLIPLLLTFLNDSGFMNYIKYASGAFSIVIIIMLIPTFIKVRKGKNNLKVLPNYVTSKVVIILIIISYLLVAVGSLIEVV